MGNRSQQFHQPLRLWFRISRYPDKTLGQRIRKARLEKGLYQVDLAKRLKVSEMTIVNWENDRTRPVKMHANRLKECLELRFSYVIKMNECNATFEFELVASSP